MKTYVITEKAGRFVAGQRNPGVGMTLRLTDKAAEAGLREGALAERKPEAAASAEKVETKAAEAKAATAAKAAKPS